MRKTTDNPVTVNNDTSDNATKTCTVITRDIGCNPTHQCETIDKSTGTNNPEMTESGCNPATPLKTDMGTDPIIWWLEETRKFLNE